MTDTAQPWLAPATAESRRFNLRIVRGRLDEILPPPGALEKEVATLQPDLVILRLRAGVMAPIHELIGDGFVPIHADTLVYHVRQLNEAIADNGRNAALVVEPANPADRARIAEIARNAFSSYRSHYHANPRLDPGMIGEGYAEWAVLFIDTQAADHETWVVRMNGEVVGFVTCALSRPGTSVEVVLNAVDPKHAGRGIYGHLLNRILLAYKERGFTTVRISTQVWNYIVQRAWAHAGFVISQAYDTYHINIPQRRG
jgi:GNAT superfamily N-acetyltransferase